MVEFIYRSRSLGGTMTEVPTEELLARAAWLIDKRRFKRAVSLLVSAIPSSASDSAAFWVTLATAYGLEGKSSVADGFRYRATFCPDYTEGIYDSQSRDRLDIPRKGTLTHVLVVCITPVPFVGWRLAYRLMRW